MGRVGQIFSELRGGGLKARVLRGSGMSALQVGGANFLRLLSNLILTRLLFPEAFGLMALTQVFIYGLQTFSDIGIHMMLIQSKRGGERVFLDTLWTMQILRGLILWVASCVIAFPAAWIYDQPILRILLPVVAFSIVIEGFKTTKEAQAMRDVRLERVIILQLIAQFAGLIVMALLAWWLRSVWALALGTLAMSAFRVLAAQHWLPGENNRLHWDWGVVRETINFGVFIFLSTLSTFFVNMGAQVVLGAYIPIAVFGIFNIANMLGTVPGLVAVTIARNVVFPLYRLKPPMQSAENRAQLFKTRRMMAVAAMVMTAPLALLGDWIINLLFDARYALAGPMMILIALRSLPIYGSIGTNQALTGCGDSRRFFYLTAASAVAQMAILVLTVPVYGVPAAILAMLVASLIIYPLKAIFTARYRAWDPLGELGLMGLGALLALLIGWIKWDVLKAVFDLPVQP